MRTVPPFSLMITGFLSAFSCLLPPVSAHAQGLPVKVTQTPASCARVWQGFSQEWGYNHRIHRLCDVVETDRDLPCTFSVLHASASGSGADSASFVQYYTEVEAPGVGFYPLSHTFILDGREGEEIAQVEELSFYHPELSDPSTSFAVMLNGFDLHSAKGASPDKLIVFEVSVDSTWSEASTQTLHIKIRSRIKMACSTAECPCLDQGVHYEMRVPLLIAVGGDFIQTRDALYASQSWTRDSLPATTPASQLLPVNPNIQLTVPAITRISMELSDEFHMLGWESWIGILPQSQSALLPLAYGLGFQQWSPGMYAAYKDRYRGFPRLPAKWVVKKKGGAASLGMDVICLQFRAGEAKMDSVTGHVGWDTRHGRKKDALDVQGEVRK